MISRPSLINFTEKRYSNEMIFVSFFLVSVRILYEIPVENFCMNVFVFGKLFHNFSKLSIYEEKL